MSTTMNTNARQIVSQMNNGLGVKYVGFYNGFMFDAAELVDGGVKIHLVDFDEDRVIAANAAVSYERV